MNKTPLESLLTLKHWEEEEAKGLFATAKKEFEIEEKRLLGLEENFKLIRDEAGCSQNGPICIDDIKKRNEHMEHLCRLIGRQKENVDASQKRLDQAKEILANASMERKIYERVEEKHKAAEMFEQKRKEQRVIDEHAVTRYKKHGC